jgi:hypothetical protein
MSKPPKICVYCGERPAVNDEHVVAKCLFTPPLPPMITVPSCRECNAGRADGIDRDLSLDEEYLRNVVCMRHDNDHPVAARLRLGKVIRSFENSLPMTKALLNGSQPVLLKTATEHPDVYLLDQSGSFNVDLSRIARVLKKIVRGLFYAREGMSLPQDYEVRMAPDLPLSTFQEMINMLGDSCDDWYGLGDNVFVYRSLRTREDRFRTVWLMVFYESFACSAYTFPREFGATVTGGL